MGNRDVLEPGKHIAADLPYVMVCAMGLATCCFTGIAMNIQANHDTQNATIATAASIRGLGHPSAPRGRFGSRLELLASARGGAAIPPLRESAAAEE